MTTRPDLDLPKKYPLEYRVTVRLSSHCTSSHEIERHIRAAVNAHPQLEMHPVRGAQVTQQKAASRHVVVRATDIGEEVLYDGRTTLPLSWRRRVIESGSFFDEAEKRWVHIYRLEE